MGYELVLMYGQGQYANVYGCVCMHVGMIMHVCMGMYGYACMVMYYLCLGMYLCIGVCMCVEAFTPPVVAKLDCEIYTTFKLQYHVLFLFTYFLFMYFVCVHMYGYMYEHEFMYCSVCVIMVTLL